MSSATAFQPPSVITAWVLWARIVRTPHTTQLHVVERFQVNAVLGVVVGDALDEAGQYFLG
jgi:hypothetical protein